MDNRQHISCALIDEGGTGLAAWDSLAAYAFNNNETFPINSTSYLGYTMQFTLSDLRRLDAAFSQQSNTIRSQSETNDDDEEWSLDGIFLSPDTASVTTNPSNDGNGETDDRTEAAFGVLQLRRQSLRFLPSFRVRGESQQSDQRRMRRALAAGVNPTALHTYQGSFDKFSLQSMNTPNERNCCLFVYKIHPSVQHNLRKFFAQIYHGKVFSFSLNPPEGNHFSCAVKLAFMSRASAELFMRDIVFPGIFIDGMRLKAYWNRDKVCPTAEHAQKSRVVCFAGPNLTLGYLEWIFNNVMYYDLVASRSWLSLCASATTGHQYEHVVEMHFSSLRGQSQMPVLRFENYFQCDERYHYWYGQDPCGP